MIHSKQVNLMWTDIEITISCEKNPIEYINNSFWLIYSMELEFSRFLKDSSLSLLNSEKMLEVSDRFIEVFNLSKEIYNKTGWIFNPLVNLSNIWYSNSFEKKEFLETLELSDLSLEKVKTAWNMIAIWKDQNLDFWWIVKWYTVDLVKNYLISKWFNDFIINAGWDIYLSWKNNWKKWIIWIDNPFKKDEAFASIELENLSVSTSWSYKRNWKIWDKNYHHILNPLNNSNENEIVSISIIAEKTYLTDSYATACFNMWVEKALKFLEGNKIDWIIISKDWEIYNSKWVEKLIRLAPI